MPLSPGAIAGLVVLGSAVAGVSIGFAVAAGLSDACVLNPQSCVVITFRRGPNNTLLVENGQYAYWFDGALIFAYGSKLPGVCPSIEALHATSTLLPVQGAPLIKNRCTRFAEDGKTCVEYANFCRKFSEEDPNTCLDCVTSTACTADTPASHRLINPRLTSDCAACLPQFAGESCSACAAPERMDAKTCACKPQFTGPLCGSCTMDSENVDPDTCACAAGCAGVGCKRCGFSAPQLVLARTFTDSTTYKEYNLFYFDFFANKNQDLLLGQYPYPGRVPYELRTWDLRTGAYTDAVRTADLTSAAVLPAATPASDFNGRLGIVVPDVGPTDGSLKAWQVRLLDFDFNQNVVLPLTAVTAWSELPAGTCTDIMRDPARACAFYPHFNPATRTCDGEKRSLADHCNYFPHVDPATGDCMSGYVGPTCACTALTMDPARNCAFWPAVDPADSSKCLPYFSNWPTCDQTVVPNFLALVTNDGVYSELVKITEDFNWEKLFRAYSFVKILRVSFTNFEGALRFDMFGFDFYALPPISGRGFSVMQIQKDLYMIRPTDTNATFFAPEVGRNLVALQQLTGGTLVPLYIYASLTPFPGAKQVVLSTVSFYAFSNRAYTMNLIAVQPNGIARVLNHNAGEKPAPGDVWFFAELAPPPPPPLQQQQPPPLQQPLPAAAVMPAVRLDRTSCEEHGDVSSEVYLSPQRRMYDYLNTEPLPCAPGGAPATYAQLVEAANRGARSTKAGYVVPGSPYNPYPAKFTPGGMTLQPNNLAEEPVWCYGKKPDGAEPVVPEPPSACACDPGYSAVGGNHATCQKTCCSVCKNLDAAGRCTDCDATAATKMDGEVFGKGSGMYVPTLTLDPTTLRVLGDGVNPATCARNLDSVKAMFSSFAPETLKVRAPGGAPPDIFQIFGFLKTKRIYVPPPQIKKTL